MPVPLEPLPDGTAVDVPAGNVVSHWGVSGSGSEGP